jgi:hypothetical protein
MQLFSRLLPPLSIVFDVPRPADCDVVAAGSEGKELRWPQSNRRDGRCPGHREGSCKVAERAQCNLFVAFDAAEERILGAAMTFADGRSKSLTAPARSSTAPAHPRWTRGTRGS